MTWQPGDLALCIFKGPWCGFNNPLHVVKGPKMGCVYEVKAVVPNNFGDVDLRFTEFPEVNKRNFWSGRFHKIQPLTRTERDEFLADLEFDTDLATLQRMYRQ